MKQDVDVYSSHFVYFISTIAYMKWCMSLSPPLCFLYALTLTLGSPTYPPVRQVGHLPAHMPQLKRQLVHIPPVVCQSSGNTLSGVALAIVHWCALHAHFLAV